MSKKKNSSSSSGITLNKVSFYMICVTAILYLVAMILHFIGINAIVISSLQAIATAIMICIVAVNAWRYVSKKAIVWKILYFVCLLVVVLGIVLPMAL